jgi:hypothetical protein
MSKKNDLSEKEIAELYGLIKGMISREAATIRRQCGDAKTGPAREWFNQWKDCPSVKKAGEIYKQEMSRIA